MNCGDVVAAEQVLQVSGNRGEAVPELVTTYQGGALEAGAVAL
jgi:hypothetical protein